MDQALGLLPPHKGKLYRGIGVRFNEDSYQTGQRVCWPAFSSASATREVAEEFVEGGDGTLFFLHCATARAISRYSQFPDEDEVLLRPNTTFTITSTLYRCRPPTDRRGAVVARSPRPLGEPTTFGALGENRLCGGYLPTAAGISRPLPLKRHSGSQAIAWWRTPPPLLPLFRCVKRGKSTKGSTCTSASLTFIRPHPPTPEEFSFNR